MIFLELGRLLGELISSVRSTYVTVYAINLLHEFIQMRAGANVEVYEHATA